MQAFVLVSISEMSIKILFWFVLIDYKQKDLVKNSLSILLQVKE